MKILETERLSLRQFDLADAPFLLELMNEPGFIQYVADRGLRTTADAAAFLSKKILPSYERFGFGFYRVELKDSHTPIGMCGFIKRDTLDEVDIGFATLERYSGRGYTFEASSAVFEYGHSVLGLSAIVGLTAPDNKVSQHLLQKLGLRFRESVDLPGYGRESFLYA
ncbi:MAG TPA: GNAT family N-acetyltransferase [Chthoniobacterales bacterium]|jgi:RimJ/RimL family protein N-acetyltransferase